MSRNTESASLIVRGIASRKRESSDTNTKGNISLICRKLPFVVAGNPVNFGKPYQLSCAEALATSLCAIGYMAQAKFIMSKFKWADGFWKQNPGIELYGNCATMEEMDEKSKQLS